MKVLFVWPNKDSFGYKPIGLALLSAIAKERGWETGLFDTTGIDFGFTTVNDAGLQIMVYKPVNLEEYGFQKIKIGLNESFIKKLDEFNPDLLAISVLSDEYFIAGQITNAAKEKRPDLPVIWGGKYPTLNPRLPLDLYNADYVCVGEGLDAFGDFLDALQTGSDTSVIPNIWAKKGNAISENDIRPLRGSLDDLPFVDWSVFDRRHFYKPYDGNVYRGGDHMLNWGCPYHCTYCINDFYHAKYNNNYFMRRYGSRRIIRELKELKTKYGLQFFKFHDEDFLMRPLDSLRELSELYREEINLPFTIETNPKSVVAEKVKLLKNMNCVSASVAIETGDSLIRKNVLKRVDSEKDVVRAFSLLKDAGIRTVSFAMLGIPYETRQTYEKTIEITRKADVQYPDIGFFFPFEGTVLREIAIREGYYVPGSDDADVYQRNKPALKFKSLGEDELVQMLSVFVLYVKLPDSYWPFIKRSEKLDELGTGLRKKLIEIFKETVWQNDGWYIDNGRKDLYSGELNDMIKSACLPHTQA